MAEDNRRVSNEDQTALKRGKSVDFTGYWQRHIADWDILASGPAKR